MRFPALGTRVLLVACSWFEFWLAHCVICISCDWFTKKRRNGGQKDSDVSYYTTNKCFFCHPRFSSPCARWSKRLLTRRKWSDTTCSLTCSSPIHLIAVVNICKYFVFCTLKKVKGPSVTVKIAWKKKRKFVQHILREPPLVHDRKQILHHLFWGNKMNARSYGIMWSFSAETELERIMCLRSPWGVSD